MNEIVGVDCLVASMHNAKDPTATVAAIEQLLLTMKRSSRRDMYRMFLSTSTRDLESTSATPEGQVEIQQVTDYLLNKTTSLVTSITTVFVLH